MAKTTYPDRPAAQWLLNAGVIEDPEDAQDWIKVEAERLGVKPEDIAQVCANHHASMSDRIMKAQNELKEAYRVYQDELESWRKRGELHSPSAPKI